MLQVEHVNIKYGDVQALWDVGITVNNGQIIAILGSNGAGKSTLLNAVVGLKQCSSGKIRFREKEIQNVPTYEVVEDGIALVPEGRHLFPLMSVEANLKLGAYSKRARRQVDDTLQFAYTIFPILKQRRKQVAQTLSGGEQQMLSIGRALMLRPELLLLDEPTQGLAPMLVDKIFDSLVGLNRQGLTIVLVEQNVMRALQISQRSYVMVNGRIELEGPSPELMTNDRIKKAYLGL